MVGVGPGNTFPNGRDLDRERRMLRLNEKHSPTYIQPPKPMSPMSGIFLYKTGSLAIFIQSCDMISIAKETPYIM